MATCSRTPHGTAAAAQFADTGMRGGSSLPAPEEEEVKRRAPIVPAAASVNRTKSGKRFTTRAQMAKEEEEILSLMASPSATKMFSARVAMTTAEKETLIAVKVQHLKGRKEYFARMDKRDELRKRFDEILFQRRCWAARLANQVFSLRADIAHVRHQLRVGWKEWEPLPEELDDARLRDRCAYIINQYIDKAMDKGLAAFVDDHLKYLQEAGAEDAPGSGGRENLW